MTRSKTTTREKRPVKKSNSKQPALKGKGRQREKQPSAEELDSALMKYMGESSQKHSLDEALDSYFKKSE